MTDDLTGEYQTIFMTIEKNVVETCREYSDLVDHNIDKVYEAVQRTLEKELQGRNLPTHRWKDNEEELYHTVEDIVRVLIGEDTLVHTEPSEDDADIDEMDNEEHEIELDTVPKEVMVKILKRLRSSVKTWTGSSAYGRRGYIDYISRFL